MLRGRYTGHMLRLGDAIRVRLIGVDLDHRRIDFIPAARGDAANALPPRARRKEKPTRSSPHRTAQRKRRP
jgi:hypothetical protein